MTDNNSPRVSPCLLTSAFCLLQTRVAGVCDQIKMDGFDVEPGLGIYERKGSRIMAKLAWMDAKSAAGYLKRLDSTIVQLDALGYDTTWLAGARDEYTDNVNA